MMTLTDFSRLLWSTACRRYGLILAVMSTTLGGSLLYLLTSEPQYESKVQVMVGQAESSISELGQALGSLTSDASTGVNPLATQSELIVSSQVLEDALDQVALELGDNEPLPSVDEVQSNLWVTIVPATNLLEINYADDDPRLTTEVLEAITRSTVQQNADIIRQEASSIREFLEERIPQQAEKLAETEVAEQAFREANGIVTLAAQAEGIVNGLSALDADARDLEGQIEAIAERQRALRTVTERTLQEAYQTVQVSQDDTVIEIRNRLTAVEAEIAAAQSRLGDRHPDLLALFDEQTQLQALLAEALRPFPGAAVGTVSAPAIPGEFSQSLLQDTVAGWIELQSLEQRLGLVLLQRAELAALAESIPQQELQLTALVRQRESAEASLRLLQEKLEEAQIAEAQVVSNLRVIGNVSEPTEQNQAQPLLVLLLGTVTGVVLSVGCIALLEAFDDTIHGAEEIETLLGLPVLSTLPPLSPQLGQYHWLSEFVGDDEQAAPYVWLLKLLEQQCDMVGSPSQLNPKGRTVIISGLNEGEDKSIISIFLAAVSAALSQRTLLVAADAQAQIQARYLGVADGVNQSVPANTCGRSFQLTRSVCFRDLYFLPNGHLHRGTVEAASVPTLVNQLPAVSQDYALTLVDTAAAGSSADAATLGRFADGIVLVVRPKTASRSHLLHTVQKLKKSGIAVLGVVLDTTQSEQAALPLIEDEFAPASTPLPQPTFQDSSPVNLGDFI